MTKCKECGTEISTTADACPKCGAKQVRTSGCAKVVLAILGFFVFASIVGTCSSNSSTSPSSPVADTTSETATSVQPSAAPPAAPPAPVVGAQWSYRQDADPMGKSSAYYAQVSSSNTVSFSAPYDGPQYGTLTLRTHPRHGKDIILSIEKGQFLCRSYEDCNVLVRFDDQKAVTYSAVGASDGSSETIFLRNYPRFVSSMSKAKRVRIAAEIYQEASPVFEFDVSGFDVDKYKPK